MINYASTRIKAQFRHYKMNQKRKVFRSQLPKIQRAVKSYLIHLRVFKRKLSVKKIENAWIKYHQQFYARKKYPMLRVLQNYIKRKKDQIQQDDKIHGTSNGSLPKAFKSGKDRIILPMK